MKTITKEFALEPLNPDEEFEKEAFASVARNRQYNYMKFVLTDDKPNANKQRVPLSEFPNLIKSGAFAPIKKYPKELPDGHDGATPLGVITHLKQTDNQIMGIAALWAKERPEDVQFIKEQLDKKEPLNISWEIGYMDSKVDEETGVEDLFDTSLQAAVLVGMPAYEGRTPVTAFSSKKLEDITLDEINELKSQLESLKTKLSEKEAELEATKPQVTELEQLRDYKASVEQREAEATKIKDIKTKFAEAGIVKDEKYFDDNREKFLSMDDNSIEFMLQELVAVASKNDEEKNSSASKVPNFVSEKGAYNVSEIVEALRERQAKK